MYLISHIFPLHFFQCISQSCWAAHVSAQEFHHRVFSFPPEYPAAILSYSHSLFSAPMWVDCFFPLFCQPDNLFRIPAICSLSMYWCPQANFKSLNPLLDASVVHWIWFNSLLRNRPSIKSQGTGTSLSFRCSLLSRMNGSIPACSWLFF